MQNDSFKLPYEEDNSLTSLISCNSTRSSSSKVSFCNVEIRQYNQTVGDNPSCSSGCPISLDWEYDKEITKMSLDLFESYRDGQRRAMHEMKLPSSLRHTTLIDCWDVTTNEIFLAEKECENIKKQRNETFRKEQMRQSIKSFAKRMKKIVIIRKD